MEQLHARNVVIGTGAMGSATAYHLAKRGEPVLLLEQFAIGHDRGSSHGVARITRHSYADPRYARLMLDAFRAWKDLEVDAGQNLYLRTGGLSFCPPQVDYVAQVAASLAAIDIPHRRMSGRALRHAFPVFDLPDDTDVVFEPDAGLLAAARAIALQRELARQFGGDQTRVLAECPVRSIDLEGNKPVVLTDALRISADRLIVTAGAWAGRLLPQFPVALRPTRQQVLYFRPNDPAPFAPGRFPVFIHKGADALDDFYGMPEYQGCGVKVARHGGPEVDPDTMDRAIDPAYLEIIHHFLKRSIPALVEASIERTEVCLYTTTPDEHFRLGSRPDCPNLIMASPCSGHGFKFSCLIGRVLADLATQGATDIDIEPWKL
ncbi:N-methyl-L-tryptophan oxidase [Singulisphaera acidiphila]|uniref:Glycine/D-amino acid oxidase, deaminating n=1 Tax=Singulisphaera acidiphila (strain ATCC BAA-1392 / DSM 18658 / VKM B-2454 / MOB10) TaxID=886293 RepID=L0D9A9_SINAD|nr:N-methyl-L-tryptophan oxidase [Singulisphaera acidiphila]AGA25246.1 glycine/D-amino acid oxidase, deaminating [Singulisphaera acidiphila DSM 18658]